MSPSCEESIGGMTSSNSSLNSDWLFLEHLSDSSKEYSSSIIPKLSSSCDSIYLSLDNGLIFTHPIASRGLSMTIKGSPLSLDSLTPHLFVDMHDYSWVKYLSCQVDSENE